MVGLALLSIVLISASAALVVRGMSMTRVRTARVLDQIGAYGFVDEVPVELGLESTRGPIEVLGTIVAGALGGTRVAALRRMLIGAGLHRMSVERYLGLSALSVIVVPLLF